MPVVDSGKQPTLSHLVASNAEQTQTWILSFVVPVLLVISVCLLCESDLPEARLLDLDLSVPVLMSVLFVFPYWLALLIFIDQLNMHVEGMSNTSQKSVRDLHEIESLAPKWSQLSQSTNITNIIVDQVASIALNIYAGYQFIKFLSFIAFVSKWLPYQ